MTDTITLDLDSLTLGEMAYVEQQAGKDFIDLLQAGRATRRLIGLCVHEYRHSETPRSWRELSALRLQDASSSTSPSAPIGPQVTSPV